MNQVSAERIARLSGTVVPVFQFFSQSAWAARQHDDDISDFVVGNPHEMPLPAFTAALQRWSEPQSKDWFAYTFGEERARQAVRASLQRRRGVSYDVEDIFLTNGATGALATALGAIIDPGDEAIFVSPPWFFYELYLTGAGAKPVRVKVNPQTHDLDVDAIAAAITPRTRAIIVNSPNNPTGVIYPPATLEALAQVLSAASERNGRPIYLLSDEAYSRILFDGEKFHSPTAFYPHSFLIYTYGKQLLTPGQRLGYLALPPTMPAREQMRRAVFLSQFEKGFAIANALLQHALPELEELCIDMQHMQHKRDWLVGALREMGYEVNQPQGTFYLLVRSPLEDDTRFIELLAAQKVFCLPGRVFEMPGYFRISLTANDAMIERALAGFERALQAARETSG